MIVWLNYRPIDQQCSMLASSYNRLPCLYSILYQIHPNKMLSEIASDAGNDSMCSNSVWVNTVRNMTHSCIHRVVKSINNYLFFDVINKPRQFCDQGKILNTICERKRLVSHCTADKILYCSTDYAYIKRNDICDVSWLRSHFSCSHSKIWTVESVIISFSFMTISDR